MESTTKEITINKNFSFKIQDSKDQEETSSFMSLMSMILSFFSAELRMR
jgi:hypothetical protein